ncbi:MAG: kinase/pyrophosphorylase [Caulobacterales bacterium]|nr:kinase/pyrophosphorylase [Caulobacterales bacterium]
MTDEHSPIAQYFHVHLVSDSTGETLMNVMKASVTLFERVIPIEHLYALVRSPRLMERVLQAIEDAPGVVMFTIVNAELRAKLERRCAELGVPCVAILDTAIGSLSHYLGRTAIQKTGAQHGLDAEYNSRIEALNFAMAHDDGQGTQDLNEADVVLVGVSRTSKTPTCIYLAHRGVKAANVPIVVRQPLPPAFDTISKPLVVGLTAAPDRLAQVRRNRLLSMNEERASSYAEEEAVREELKYAKRIFAARGWPVIDVTRRSVEETSAKIVNFLNDRDSAYD